MKSHFREEFNRLYVKEKVFENAGQPQNEPPKPLPEGGPKPPKPPALPPQKPEKPPKPDKPGKPDSSKEKASLRLRTRIASIQSAAASLLAVLDKCVARASRS